MPLSEQTTLLFTGVDAQSTPSALGEGDVATATNIDFDLERGCATVRRGCLRVYNFGSTNITSIYRHYNNPSNIGASPFYVTESGGKVWRVIPGTSSTVITSSLANNFGGIISYREHAYISNAAGSAAIKDDGTDATFWCKFAPAHAPTITISTTTEIVVSTVWTVSEGTLSGSGTATATADSDLTSNRIEFDAPTLSTNLNTNASAPINDYGIHYLRLAFSNPSLITRVTCDYSIGDTTFQNYYHAELVPEDVAPGLAGSDDLIVAQLAVGTGTDTNVDLDVRQQSTSDVSLTPRITSALINAAANTFNTWAIPRTHFQLINSANTPPSWNNIGAVRVVIEATAPITAYLTGWTIGGSEDFPLSDPNVGYAYWTTFAKIINGNVQSESAPSPPTARTKIQAGQFIITDNNLPNSNADDITHKIFYRQGGFLGDAYAVATVALASATNTATDKMTDVQALTLNNRMLRNILKQSEFVGNAYGAQDAFYDRLFVVSQNYLYWSLPGQPSAFPRTSQAQVSNSGDTGRGLVVWAPYLVIVNRDSVYELQGNIFEGTAADYIISRTGSKHGSKSYGSIVKTPYGILLLDYEGLFLYHPGQGQDEPIGWAMEKMGDVFRGEASTDPATLKGNRIPPMFLGHIDAAVATYGDEKIFLGLPTLANTTPDTLFVLNFRTKQVEWYKYGFNFTSLYWDMVGNQLLAGTTDGKIMQLEVGQYDTNTSAATSGATWTFRTRKWTTNNDAVLENLTAESIGTTTVLATIDSTSTLTLGTLTNTIRQWTPLRMSGTVGRCVEFNFAGTKSISADTKIFGLRFNALIEPPRIQFFKTDYEAQPDGGESLWDVAYCDIEITGTGTVSATSFVDGTAIITNTIVGPTSGRNIRDFSFPNFTYGRVANTIYTSTGTVFFKHWSSQFDRRQEPPRINSYQSDVTSLEENICDAMDCDIACGNINVLSTVFVDNTPIGTFTNVGNLRQSFTNALPNELYGRTIYAIHNGSGFKHYKTWFHMRPEPDRWTNYVSERRSGNEKRYQTFECDINPFNNTVLATVVLDNVAISTHTISPGSGRESYPFALPLTAYGRTIYAIYNVSGSGRFKYYRDWFEGEDEPDRLTSWQTTKQIYDSDQYLKTWNVDLNPLAGTVNGTLFVDDVAVTTQTFNGLNRAPFTVGLDVNSSIAIQKGAGVYINYVGTSTFKHYNTKLEVGPKPSTKTTWAITYDKVGGASQLDIPRFYSMDIEVPTTGTATITSIWDVDGTAISTNTLTFTGVGREWRDRISFPPTGRGYLVQQRLLSSLPIQVWRSNVDCLRVGVKGLARQSTVSGVVK